MLNEAGNPSLPPCKGYLLGSWWFHVAWLSAQEESERPWLTHLIPSVLLAERHREKLARGGEGRGSNAHHASCLQTSCRLIPRILSSLFPIKKSLKAAGSQEISSRIRKSRYIYRYRYSSEQVGGDKKSGKVMKQKQYPTKNSV